MTLIDQGPRPRPQRPTTRIAEAIESAAPLDTAAKAAGLVAQRLVGTGARRDLLSGTWLGHPVHPMLVALPIGAWTSASVLDLLGQRRAARSLIGIGLLAVPPTAATGVSDWAHTTGSERRVGLVHMAANAVASVAYTKSWLNRRKGRDARGVLWALAGASVTGASGWLGGHLAYSLGVGADTNAFDAGPQEWTRLEGDVPAGGPEPGQAVAARAGGTGVVVASSGGTIRALADRCSHRGGPLSEGTVADGCITCPWHGSRFDLETGEVVRGPAVAPQPVFEVRRSGSGFEVRRDEERSLRTNPV